MLTAAPRDREHRQTDAPPRHRAQGPSRSQLGELLVSAQLISHDQLAEALIQQSASGKRIGTTLVELGAINERDLAKALSTQLLRPHGRPVPADPVARGHRRPARERGPSPSGRPDRRGRERDHDRRVGPHPELAKILANACGQIVRLVIAPTSDVQRAIDTAYRALGNIQEHVRAFEESSDSPQRLADAARADGHTPAMRRSSR